MRLLHHALALAVAGSMLAAPGLAASKKTEISKERRAEIMKQARALCKKKLGPTSTVYRLEILNNGKSFRVRCSTY